MAEQYLQNSFSPLFDSFNTHAAFLPEWFSKIELYELLYMHRTTFSASLPFEGEHEHRFWEIHVFTDGTQQYTVDGVPLTLHAGEFLLICPNVPHRQEITESGYAKFAMMLRIPQELPPFAAGLLPALTRQGYFRATATDAMCAPLSYLFRNADIHAPACLPMLQATVFLFMQALFSLLQEQTAIPPAATTVSHGQRNDSALFEDTVSYIENHISRIVTIEETAASLFISSRQLNRRLKAYYGASFSRLAEQVRCDFAKELLRYADLTVEKIGEKVGYSDTGSFIHFFKRVSGRTPAAYRRYVRALPPTT